MVYISSNKSKANFDLWRSFCQSESISYAEQNLYSRAIQLVGDKNPRHHEFTVQLRAFDAAKSGAKVGVAALIAQHGTGRNNSE